MSVEITKEAAELVRRWTKEAEVEIGAGYVPVVMWQVSDSSAVDFSPMLALGFEKRDKVDRRQAMISDGHEVEIYFYVPPHVMKDRGAKRVTATGDSLVFE